jgi:hypothetical protein
VGSIGKKHRHHFLANFFLLLLINKNFKHPTPSSLAAQPRPNKEGAVRRKNYLAFLHWQNLHCKGTKVTYDLKVQFLVPFQ